MPENEDQKASFKKVHLIPIILVLLIIIGGLVWLYTGSLNSAKKKVFSKLPLPAAIIDYHFLSSSELISRLNLADKVLADQAAGAGNPGNVNQRVYDQLVDSKKLESIATSKKVKVSSQEIDNEFKNVMNQFSQGDENKFKDDLKNTYGLSENDFKNQVIREEILQINLAIWFNGQESLNGAAFNSARDLMSKLDSGQKFEDVASSYTADASTKDFAGDSGFIAEGDLLPEFQNALKDVPAGQTKLVVSRYGLHIIKVLEKDNNGDNGSSRVHLQQIFVKPADFAAWYNDQASKLKVIKLLKI